MRTEILCILDRSGSMAAITEDAVGGFNTFLAAQKAEPGRALLTLVLFNHDYQTVMDAAPIGEVAPLDASTYVPSGTTALLDAVGRTIETVGERIKKTPDAARPDKVVVCILTDGLENASSDYSRDRVRYLIERQQRRFGWEFVFLGANQDAFGEAGRLGVAPENVRDWDHSGAGVRMAQKRMSDWVSEKRRRGR